jgi:L-cysteine desulfidase
MKGKKKDHEFISQFIQQSAQQGCTTPIAILAKAKKSVEQIDQEIRAMVDKKILRSKLLDVIETFETKVSDKSYDRELLRRLT